MHPFWKGFIGELTKLANGDESGSETVTEEQKERIRDYLRKNKITDDDKFHRFVESMGISPHAAEPIAYQMAHEAPPDEVNKAIPGGKAEGKKPEDFDMLQLAKGVRVELEHTPDRKKALEIAMDHLEEFPNYYDALEEMEAKLKHEKTARMREAKKLLGWVQKKKPQPIKVPKAPKKRGEKDIREEARTQMKSFLRTQG